PEIMSAHPRASSSAARAVGLSSTPAIFSNSWIASGGHKSSMACLSYLGKPTCPQLQCVPSFGRIVVMGINTQRDASLRRGSVIGDVTHHYRRHTKRKQVGDCASS